MHRLLGPAFAVVCVASGAHAQAPVPVLDHHQHLFSPEVVARTPSLAAVDADRLVALLDEAGIRRALVLSLFNGWWDVPTTPERPQPGFLLPQHWFAAFERAGYRNLSMERWTDGLRTFGGVYWAFV